MTITHHDTFAQAIASLTDNTRGPFAVEQDGTPATREAITRILIEATTYPPSTAPAHDTIAAFYAGAPYVVGSYVSIGSDEAGAALTRYAPDGAPLYTIAIRII